MPRARNVILFIGDGMGISTVTAARIYAGQQLGLAGEEHRLSFEHFPQVALVKTYNTNQQVPDSAGTSTALHSGVKTRAGLIGLGPSARRGKCRSANGAELDSLLDLAEDRGYLTGLVTNTRITHATLATLYAHAADRDWESDAKLSTLAKLAGCKDIARQLVEYNRGDGIDVILGGGRQAFISRDLGGERDGRGVNLLKAWQSGKQRVLLDNAKQLARLETAAVNEQQVLGLFSASHMEYVARRRSSNSSEPDLPSMASKALALLQGREPGYLLVVEGGRIDHGHHQGKAGYALAQTVEFAEAVGRVLKQADLSETLIIVTADHSHTLTIGGYPTRGNPILGVVIENDRDGNPKQHAAVAADGKPYTTLAYQNGPGATQRPRDAPQTGIEAVQQALIPTAHGSRGRSFGTHSGEDVALYAIGAGAGHFGGVLEQEQVFHRIVQALGWAPQLLATPTTAGNKAK